LSDDDQGQIHGASEGGVIGQHPASPSVHYRVGPATGSEANTIQIPPVAILCWKVEDIRFAFDSSFVTFNPDPLTNPGDPTSDPNAKPFTKGDIRDELVLLASQLKQNPGCPLAVFGHADPVGPAVDPDGYNKALSGRRATAIYALLISGTQAGKAVSLWQGIASQENWGTNQAQIMQQATGLPNGTPVSGLIASYVPKLVPPEYTALKIGPANFLAQGADSQGKGDYQGCSSFNPLLIFSQQKQDSFAAGANDQDPQVYAARNLANAPNRRVMVLIFKKGSLVDPSKWPCPSASGDKSGCIKRFWSDGDKRRHTRLPDTDRKFEATKDTFACRFYDRLLTGSPCEKILPRKPALLEVILDSNNNFVVDAAEPVATFVRLGIWDHAFDPANGNLINNSADAHNFIGRDSKGPEARRFYFRVTDPNASGQKEVRVNWRTEFGGGGSDDAPASQVISLTPTAADPTVFVSHAVFLVSDTVDQAQATDSGLGAGNPDHGSRALGESNHRIRLITVNDAHQLDSTIVAEYTPLGGAMVKASVPVFQRSPEERLKINVHLVNVRNTAGGAGALTAARKQTAIDTLRSVYARCGIFLVIDEIVIDPPASCINWRTRYPASAQAIAADPAVESYGFPGANLVPSASQTDIINAIRNQPGFDANDIYIVYVTRIFNNPVPAPSPTAVLALGPGGASFPDSWCAAGSIARSFVFVGVQTVNQFADPHEMTHVTTNLRNSAGGHFHLEANVNTGPGNIDGRNLMQRFALIANGNTADSKRLWDEDFTNNHLTPAKLPAQITAIRASRFVRPF
jgi:hypothetical protein